MLIDALIEMKKKENWNDGKTEKNIRAARQGENYPQLPRMVKDAEK